MDKVFYNALTELISTNKDCDLEENLRQNVTKALNVQNVTLDDVYSDELLRKIDLKLSETDTVQWKYIGVLSRTFLGIVEHLKSDPDVLLSVNLQKCMKSSFEFVVSIGVLPTLIPGVGVPLERRIDPESLYKAEEIPPLDKYHRLKSMCNLFGELCTQSVTKSMVYGGFLKDYLSALFQLAHAPVVRPGTRKLYDGTAFEMTEEMWTRLVGEQRRYKELLDSTVAACYKPLLVRELLILQSVVEPSPPMFMKKILSRELSRVLVSSDGLLSTVKCFFEGPNVDIGGQWKHIDCIKRLVSVRHGTSTDEEYLRNMCGQIKAVIDAHRSDDYMIVAAACVTSMYEHHPDDDSVSDLIEFTVEPLLFKGAHSEGTLVLSTDEVTKIIKSLDVCFNTSETKLPLKFITPILYNLFAIRANCSSDLIKYQLDGLLLSHFSSKLCRRDELFGALIFRRPHKDITIVKNIVFESTDCGVRIKYSSGSNEVTCEAAADTVLEMISKHPDKKQFALDFYLFCLTSLIGFDGVRTSPSSKDLLLEEDDVHDLIGERSESLLVLVKALERLSSTKSVLDAFKSDPGHVVEFMLTFLKEYSGCLSEGTPFRNEDSVVVCLTLLSVLLSERDGDAAVTSSLGRIGVLIGTISDKSERDDVKLLCTEIESTLSGSGSGRKSEEASEFEKALDEVCDPLLPVRAHGLIHLTKLIEKKDAETVSKKHYVQCIFEENLKSDDSYIYLTSINGLAALVTYSPEDILEVLAREFTNERLEVKQLESEENEQAQIRMKIGEVLVRVTRSLGEMAAPHKALLLNTFLCGCRDRDDLIRASSLSNLAEVAQVISYRVECVLYELLTCVKCILETDRSQECRRASVMVVSSLIKGLGKDTVYLLRDALLPIYRTLKKVYSDEGEDHTVRLHAQIGIEELNNVVRGSLLAPIKMEKRIVIPDGKRT